MSKGNQRLFVIFTRGRTGSTAIVDELNSHPDIVCGGEVFRKNRPDAAIRKSGNLNDAIPLFIDFIDGTGATPDAEGYRAYLDQVMDHAARAGKRIVGFKLLANQLAEREGLLSVLKERQCLFLHLVRQNVLKQAISGMVAMQRGAYNLRNYSYPKEKHVIDLQELLLRMRRNALGVATERRTIADAELNSIEIVYERFMRNRRSFYRRVLRFLGAAPAVLKRTDWSIMTAPLLCDVVSNYRELRQALRREGYARYCDRWTVLWCTRFGQVARNLAQAIVLAVRRRVGRD